MDCLILILFRGYDMRYLLLILLLLLSFLSNSSNASNAFDTKNKQPVYWTYGDDIYQIYDNKAYKVEVIDNVLYTSNLWFPLDQRGYTEEHVRKVKERNKRKERN